MTHSNSLLIEWIHSILYKNPKILKESLDSKNSVIFWVTLHDIWLKESHKAFMDTIIDMKGEKIIDFFANEYPKKPEGISREEATDLILEAINNTVIQIVESDITNTQDDVAIIEKLAK